MVMVFLVGCTDLIVELIWYKPQIQLDRKDSIWQDSDEYSVYGVMEGNIISKLARFYHVNYRDCVILNGYLIQLLRSRQHTGLFDKMY